MGMIYIEKWKFMKNFSGWLPKNSNKGPNKSVRYRWYRVAYRLKSNKVNIIKTNEK